MMRQRAEALDQVAGEEARHEHAQHMPLQHQRGALEGVAALLPMAIGVAAISRFITP
jgi:hypothetical protein